MKKFYIMLILAVTGFSGVSGQNGKSGSKYPTDIAYAYCAYDPTGSCPEGPIHFILNTPGVVTSIAPTVTQDYLTGTSWANGEWYAAENSISNNSPFLKINPNTGAITYINMGTGINVTGLAYDWTSNVMYAIAISTVTSLYTIDLVTGNPTLVGNIGPDAGAGLGCDQNGNLFMIDVSTDFLVQIDENTGTPTNIGPIGLLGNFSRELEFDNTDNTMYYLSYNSNNDVCELRAIDLLSGATSLFGDYPPGMDVTALAIYNQPFNTYPDDIGVTAFIAPVSSTNLGPNETVILRIRNFGSAFQSNFPISLIVDGVPQGVQNCPLVLLPGTETNWVWPLPVDLSAWGNHTLVACTLLPNDQNTSNDCNVSVVSKILPTWSDTVWPQDLPYWTGSTNGTSFTQNSLIKVISGDVEAGWAKFDITNIPDNVQINSLQLGYYMNYQSMSPALNINNLVNDPMTGDPVSVFNEIRTGANYISTNNGYSVGWHTFDLPALAKSDLSNATLQNWFALGFYEFNNCPACFLGTLDGWDQTHKPYLLIDYSYMPMPNDVGISAILSPVTGAGLSNNEPITVVIKNYGTNNLVNIPVNVTITGPSGTQVISGTYSGNLPAGATTNFTFTTTGNFNLFGNYTIHACTGLMGDSFANNDCKDKIITSKCPLVVQSIDHPISGVALTSAESFDITLKNIGTTDLSNVELQYTLNGSAPTVVTYPGPLAPNASTIFNIGTLDLHLFGTYTIQVCPSFSGNTYPNDGCSLVSVENSLPTVTDTFWPANAAFWTGSTNGLVFTQNSLIKVNSGNVEAGWATFDITGMPDGVTLNTVDLHFYTSSQSGSPEINLKRLTLNPMVSSPNVVMNAIVSGQTYVAATNASNPGWHSYMLGSQAITDLQNQTSTDRFSIGFHAWDNCSGCYNAEIEGWSGLNKPYIVVNYTPPIAHDIAVLSIDVDTLFAIGSYTPKATVKNLGLAADSFTVTMVGPGGYSSTKSVALLPPGILYQITFDTWNAPAGYVCLSVTSTCATDLNFNNDHLTLCWNNVITSNVFGKVTYKNAASTVMEDSTMVLLTRVNPPGLIYVDTVDAIGNYLFTNLIDGTYSLQVISQKAWGGCNASDALAVLKHFVGMTMLTGLNLKAADANADGLVNSVDALMILQRFISLLTAFPAGDWVSDQPFVTMPPAQYTPVNLKVLCTGDVNGSYVP